MDLPAAARRLLPHEPPASLDLAVAPDFVIERLLEEGDGTDLRWIAARVGEARLAGWLTRRGARRLSPRSRCFWELLLGVEGGGRRETAAEVWPR